MTSITITAGEASLKITAQDLYSLYAPSPCGLRVYLRTKGEPETEPGDFEQVLFRLGRRHEAAHVASFHQVADLRQIACEDRFQKTLDLVDVGTPVLYQPVLKSLATIDGITCEVVGEPDFLIRERDGYVIRDVKLVRRVDGENHPEVILQLQLYGWLYEQVFGVPPTRLEVLNGQSGLVTVAQDVENVLRHLRKMVEIKTLGTPPYSPVGWTKCAGCGFRDHCWEEAKATNDVALVVGVDQGLALELHRHDVRSIEELVNSFEEGSLARFRRPWGEGRQRVGRTARRVLRSARALLTNTETVLAVPAIPECDSYVMFDLEGLPPQLDEFGKTYLWGMQVFGNAHGEYQPAVARFGESGDEQGWHDFLTIADALFQRHGDIPFVHWSCYEKTQINEYIRRYGDSTGIADHVLDNLVDLLPITREAVVLPLFSYSLKEVERYIGFKRSQLAFGGSWSMAKFIEASETEDELLRSQVMDEILLYNKEDLAATWAVFQWLRDKREAELAHVPV